MQDSADDNGFRGFYEHLQPRAISVARRLLGDTALAEDIAAEAFARAYARWGKVRQHPNPDAWLLRVVGNLCIDYLRHEQRKPQAKPEQVRSDPSGDSAALRIDLTDAMQHLSGRQQEVIVLRYLIDLPEEEVASALGMSSGSVKTHLHRATTKLRKQMKNVTRQPAEELLENGMTDG
ncbi:MAG: SigE family RNA polymerase sigma factor [Actinomycetes bacterium]